MFRRNDPKPEYSAKEIALFTAIDERHKTSDPVTSPAFVELMNHHTPQVLYRSATEFAFAFNWQGPHIEALRRAWKRTMESGMKRLTPAWDDLITFE